MNKISVIILTKNSEKTIDRALKSVKGFNEIIIIDDYSEDNTIKIVNKYQAKVYKRRLNSNFSEQRNFGLSKSTNDWVLFIDSDEYIEQSLLKEINRIDFHEYGGYYICRQTYFFGKLMKYGEFSNFRLLRLGNKNKGKWTGDVHEVWKIEDSIGGLNQKIIHNPEDSVHNILDKINKYSDIRADELFINNSKAGFSSILIYTIGKFVNLYILKLGILDGVRGFLSALFMTMYTFMTRSKLWLKQNVQ